VFSPCITKYHARTPHITSDNAMDQDTESSGYRYQLSGVKSMSIEESNPFRRRIEFCFLAGESSRSFVRTTSHRILKQPPKLKKICYNMLNRFLTLFVAVDLYISIR
jgi:hypothetical protein